MKAFIGTPTQLAEAFARHMHERLNELLLEDGAPGNLIDAWEDVPDDVRRMSIKASQDTLRRFALVPSAMLHQNN